MPAPAAFSVCFVVSRDRSHVGLSAVGLSSHQIRGFVLMILAELDGTQNVHDSEGAGIQDNEDAQPSSKRVTLVDRKGRGGGGFAPYDKAGHNGSKWCEAPRTQVWTCDTHMDRKGVLLSPGAHHLGKRFGVAVTER